MAWWDTLVSVFNKTNALPATPANETTAQNMLSTEVQHDSHFHNREYWFGKSADQSGNNWGTRAGLTYRHAW